jgi:hypothetical protein
VTIIAGTTVDWTVSPRIITIPSPLVEVTIEDLQDTLLDLEDDEEGIIFPFLRKTSGGEALGGGVTVGLTMEQQNARLSFAARTTPAETGTATSTGTTILVDTTALFVTNLVTPGALLINFDDRSVATVISITNETTLVHAALTGGIANDWTVGDNYSVTNEIQCSIVGGNLVAVDDVEAELDPVFPTVGTQIVRTSASSATLQELQDIQFASFNGGVTIDVLAGNSGTEFPAGTPRQPCDGFPDCKTIADDRGLIEYFIRGNITLDTGDDVSNHIMTGQSLTLTKITINPGANVLNTDFRLATITGTLDGGSTIADCTVQTLNFVEGMIRDCMLAPGAVITLGGTKIVHLMNSMELAPGTNVPIIDLGGSGHPIAVRNYAGQIRIKNKTGSDAADFDLLSGSIFIEDTVTTGTIVLSGVGRWENKDTYAGGATIVNELVEGDIFQIISKIMKNRIETNPVTGVMTVFDDDDVTVLLTGNIYEDVLAAQIYRGRGIERRNRLT